MKFKNGDKVVVIKAQEEYKGCLGCTGVIVDVDPEWTYPYEIVFDNEKLRDEQEMNQMQELFAEDEIELESIIKVKQNEANVSYYIDIKWQDGTVDENGVNGVQIEDVIDILVARLEGFQKGGYPCRENALAITKLEEARMWLNERTRKRIKQGVEGKYEKHK